MIPQANPGAGYRALKPEIDEAVARALSSGWYILGNELRAFEAEFATWLGATAVVGCLPVARNSSLETCGCAGSPITGPAPLAGGMKARL